jgi:hypothetical protein
MGGTEDSPDERGARGEEYFGRMAPHSCSVATTYVTHSVLVLILMYLPIDVLLYLHKFWTSTVTVARIQCPMSNANVHNIILIDSNESRAA